MEPKRELTSVGILFSINRGRKADNHRIEFDASIVSERITQEGETTNPRFR